VSRSQSAIVLFKALFVGSGGALRASRGGRKWKPKTLSLAILGPVIAVAITLWSQKRSEKRNAKQHLFMTLMAHRRAGPIREWVNALNLIDVVYAGDTKVVQLWHQLYDILSARPFNEQTFGHKYIDLLSAMASSLGHRSLKQTDIDKFYAPHSLGDQEIPSTPSRLCRDAGWRTRGRRFLRADRPLRC
jgi:hypothetical protein